MAFLHLLEGVRTPLFDSFFQFITNFGDETLFIVFGLLFFWCVDKKEGYYLLIVGLIGTLVNQMLKLYFRIPRPWVRDPSFTIVESARAGATGYSFPSGHTQTAVGVYGSVARWPGSRMLRIVCAAVGVLVAFSRMYLGVHTPADVFVSAFFALVLVFVLYPVMHHHGGNARVMRIILVGSTLLSLLYLAFVHFYPFPADIDAANYAHGMESGYKLLGCILGLLLTHELDVRYTRFETKAPLKVQIVKLALGMIPLLLIKSALKSPLYALLGNILIADCIRYFLVVVYAGCIWPLTFPWLTRRLSK